jgi:HlyD family secretion protein
MKILLVLLILALGGGAAWWFGFHNAEAPVKFRTAKVERGDLRISVASTGTVQPFLLVQVGTQVTGTIQKLMVDFNSKVKANQIVAQIDPSPFQAKVDQDKANVVKAEADVIRVKANLTQAEKELARARELQKKELISGSDLDTAVANFDSLAAQVQVADASVIQAKAVLDSSMVNLRYTTIISPIDGVVISRNVDVGQTVAASLAAPTIYVISDDMKRMQIQASVAEADIGKIKEAMDVTFTVDAYRTDKFKGKVSQIRLSATTVQNVVTYTVMIDADNPGSKLLPGMTANVAFEIAQYQDVLKVPNAALRFTPPEAAGAPAAASAAAPAPKPETAAAADPSAPKPPRGERHKDQQSRVWIAGPNGPIAVQIVADATDGTWTRLVKGELTEGQELLTGIVLEGTDSTTNPFAPNMGPRPGGAGGQRGGGR